MIFERTFDNLTEEDIALLNQYFDGFDYQSSSHTFLANYIWRDTHHLSWQIIGEYLCIAGRGDVGEDEREYFMSFPLTRTGKYDIDSLRYTICEAKKIFEKRGQNNNDGFIFGKATVIVRGSQKNKEVPCDHCMIICEESRRIFKWNAIRRQKRSVLYHHSTE